MCFLNIRWEGAWCTYTSRVFHKEVATTEKAWFLVMDFLPSLGMAICNIRA